MADKCAICDNFDRRYRAWRADRIDGKVIEEYTFVFATWKELREHSARCATCKALVELDGLGWSYDLDDRELRHDEQTIYASMLTDILLYSGTDIGDVDKWVISWGLSWGLWFVVEDQVRETISQTHQPPNRIDMGTIKSWIQDCDLHHAAHCKPSHVLHPTTPSNIVVVDVVDGCLSRLSFFEPVKFVALSYCWGTIDPSCDLRSTKANQKYLFERGAFSSTAMNGQIPATVLDAMTIVRDVGLRYLWVDRLCIVQDDEDSMHSNLDSMARIYSEAYFVIIASEGTHAASDISGIGSTSRKKKHVYTFGKLSLLLRGAVEDGAADFGYNTRAWTFQERVLAFRKLIFYQSTVKWVCPSQTCHEFRKDKSRLPKWQLGERFEYKYTPKQYPDIGGYVTLAQSFSTRHLTNPKDALRAFGAIVDGFSSKFPGGFFFAVPEFYFNIALFWRQESPARVRSGLPSWSWIAWDGGTELPDIESRFISHEWFSVPQAMAFWRKRQRQGGPLIAMNNTMGSWAKYAIDTNLEPPSGWSRRGIFYVHDSLQGQNFSFPLPLSPSDLAPRLHSSANDPKYWSPYLYGSVKLACVQLHTAIDLAKKRYAEVEWVYVQKSHDQRIGIMEISEPEGNKTWNRAIECSVVALNLVTVRMASTDEDWFEDDRVHPLYEMCKADLSSDQPFSYIQVLWVEELDGIWYRRGSGLIEKTGWDTLDAQVTEIVLG